MAERFTQGDSGGPLTTVKEDGAHVLVGIVSKRLGESCSEQNFAVFTSVSALLPWVRESITEYGGMASCSEDFSASPVPGIILTCRLRLQNSVSPSSRGRLLYFTLSVVVVTFCYRRTINEGQKPDLCASYHTQ